MAMKASIAPIFSCPLDTDIGTGDKTDSAREFGAGTGAAMSLLMRTHRVLH